MDTLETETSSTIVRTPEQRGTSCVGVRGLSGDGLPSKDNVIKPISKQELRKSVEGIKEQNTLSKTEDTPSPSLNTTYYPHKYNYNNAQNKEYAKVLCDIRNMQVLRTTHRIAIQQFSRDQLLEIIEVYNLIVQNVNYMFS
jgi:hypothetical protein